jgi:hypothetical protein
MKNTRWFYKIASVLLRPLNFTHSAMWRFYSGTSWV